MRKAVISDPDARIRDRDDSYSKKGRISHDVVPPALRFTGVTDSRGRLEIASEAAINELGYTERDAIRKPFWEAAWFSPSIESQKKVKDALLRSIGGESVRCRVDTFPKKGHSFPMTFSFSLVKGREGDMVSIVSEQESVYDDDYSEAFKTTEQKLASILELSHEGCFGLDTKGRIVSINYSGARLLGYGSAEELVGMRMAQLWASAEQGREFLKELAQDGRITGYKSTFKKEDDEQISLELDALLLHSEDESCMEIWGVFREVHSTKGVSSELGTDHRRHVGPIHIEWEERYRAIFDSPIQAVFVNDLNGHFIEINDFVKELTGYSDEQFATYTYKDLVHPEDYTRAVNNMSKVAKGGTTSPTDVRFITRSGDTVWLTLLLVPLVQNGRVSSVLGFAQDITERRKAEDELRRSEEQFKRMLENMQDGYFRTDEFGNVSMANPRAAELVGVDWLDDLVGTNVTEVMSSEEASTLMELMKQKGAVRRFEFEAHRKDGSTIPLEFNAQLVVDENGDVVGFEGLARDIIERRRVEQELKESQEKLRELVHKLKFSQEELSTPVIQVWDHVLVLPLMGVIDSHRARKVMDSLLPKIGETQTEVLVLDVTGVAAMDAPVTNQLVRTVQACRLLGTECVLTGITPDVAQSLIRRGIDMRDIITRRDLQDGLKWALSRMGYEFRYEGVSGQFTT
ncbi:MAG: PAS domain S-box protein [Chloroflexota bacterium]|nr:PAS domain S-box protein [Chloroflexota bacterium]